MSKYDMSLIEDYISIYDDGSSGAHENLKTVFIDDLPSVYDGESIFEEINDQFAPEEIPEICAKLLITITASCEADDFHDWDYEHLAFIIELSNNYDFKIPQKFLNGLPSQLILLVDSEKIDDAGCR